MNIILGCITAILIIMFLINVKMFNVFRKIETRGKTLEIIIGLVALNILTNFSVIVIIIVSALAW